MKIPTIIEPYKEGLVETSQAEFDEPFEHKDARGHNVLVYKWVRYPSYEFIFGIPAPDSPKHELEYSYFEFRKQGGGWQFYADQNELEEMIQGFIAVLNASQSARPDEWHKFNLQRPKIETNADTNS